MNPRYLSFPELPDEYMWYYDTHTLHIKDVDLLLDKPGTMYARLRGWVYARDGKPLEACERNETKHTFKMPVDSVQDGIDLLAARCWLGMTGVENV